jgi:hypothetical protein
VLLGGGLRYASASGDRVKQRARRDAIGRVHAVPRPRCSAIYRQPTPQTRIVYEAAECLPVPCLVMGRLFVWSTANRAYPALQRQ